MEENRPDLIPEMRTPEDLSLILKIVCVLLPIVGIILYFVYQKNEPVKAKSACNMALIGMAIGLVFRLIQGF